MAIQFGGYRNFGDYKKFRTFGKLRSRALSLLAAATVLAGMAAAVPPMARADEQLLFTGTTVSGEQFNGSSLAGKPAVLWFWAPQCPFCNEEAPHVSAVAAANPQVRFVGVAGRAAASDIEGFVSRYNLGFTTLNDSDGSVWRHFSVPWQPAYVFLNSNGTSEFVNNTTSAMSEQELTDRVKALT